MSVRKLNIPSLGFEVVVIGASDGTNKVIADMIEKKVAVELDEEESCSICACVGCSEDQCCDHEGVGQ